MNDSHKEQLLHKIVATSAFLFALCILPVAQYLLVDAQLSNTTENGQVAGVSTDKTITQANVPAPDCEATKAKDLADLQKFQDGSKIAYERTFDQSVEGYKGTLALLEADPTAKQEEKDAVNTLIDAQQQPYLAKLAQLDTAVESQKASIEARSCPAE